MPRTNSTMNDQLKEAVQWYLDNQNDPDNRATVTATANIFKLKVNTLRKAIQCQLTLIQKANKPCGRPSFLKPYQIEALCTHIQTQAYDGNPLNRAMVIRAATHLNNSGEELFRTWLQ
ncbi:hypothetical protein B7463_g11729, partial [Scytalidium lignicola]